MKVHRNPLALLKNCQTASLPVQPGESIDGLTQRVHVAEHQIYPLAVRWFAEGRLRLAEQGAMLDGAILPASGYQIRI